MLLHRFQLAKILRSGAKPAASAGDLQLLGGDRSLLVDEAGKRLSQKKAARIGVERFVMDDGWFGARNTTTPDWGIGR